MLNSNTIFLIIVVILCLYLYFKFFKILKTGVLCMVTGGVKKGKSLLSVFITIRKYNHVHFAWKINTFFRKIFKKQPLEEPLFYCNIPVAIPHVRVTEDILLMKKRCRNGSVMFIDEASLFADSQLIKDMSTNNRLLLFNKLCGHAKLSLLLYDTQQIEDCHYSIKRSLSTYYDVQDCIKWIPFFVILKVREYKFSLDKSVVNVSTTDIMETYKRVIIPKWYYKKYDSKCYYPIFKDLPIEDNIVIPDKKDLKCKEIVSFRKEFNNLAKVLDTDRYKIKNKLGDKIK